MEAFLMEIANAKVTVDPVDFNTAAVTGVRVPVKGYDRVTFIAVVNSATSATARTFTLRQHNAASSGTSKDLSVSNPYYHKVAAATSFTKVVPSSATAAYDLLALIGDDKAIVVFEVLAEDLDVTNDFNYVSVDTADSGAASIGCIIAIPRVAAYLPAYTTAI